MQWYVVKSGRNDIVQHLMDKSGSCLHRVKVSFAFVNLNYIIMFGNFSARDQKGNIFMFLSSGLCLDVLYKTGALKLAM